MVSNAARGARAKARTKAWLTAKGYQVADLETVRWVFSRGERIPIKRDQFASDLLAVNAINVIFVQVKSGQAACGGTFPDARRKFQEFTFPSWTKRVVIAWPPRARSPRIVRCEGVVQHGEAQATEGRRVSQPSPEDEAASIAGAAGA